MPKRKKRISGCGEDRRLMRSDEDMGNKRSNQPSTSVALRSSTSTGGPKINGSLTPRPAIRKS